MRLIKKSTTEMTIELTTNDAEVRKRLHNLDYAREIFDLAA